MASFASSNLCEQRSRVAVNNLRRRHMYGRVLFEDRNPDCSVSDLEHPNGSLAHPAFTSASFHSPKAKILDTRINFPDRLKTAIGHRQPLSPTSPCLSMRKLTHVWTMHVSTISNVTRATNPVHSPTLLDIFVSHNVEAYRHLQDTNMPRFHGHFLMLIPSQGNRNVNVLLMEYIGGP
ncbi:hypothetical protein EV421DRAFT_1903841 [Armillaria borealis]|uniref:Uncharacterized protein n=1 Tax=Armillaria borealis TaxID=47425 RepID=A0AA39JHH7_9AGAR|nr:hypothetical protein EV421DRAFT_1903841 [Armillaria borealis]